MYIPRQFKNDNQKEIIEFIEQHSFGILFSEHDGEQKATHLPFIIKEIDNNVVLYTHMAKANPQWKSLKGKSALAVFTGPHAYISASWYEEPNSVSTWNYVSAHVYGKIEIITDPHPLKEILKLATDFYERDFSYPWKVEDNLETVESMLNGIVGIKLEVEKLEGKWKLNQHHTTEKKNKVIKQLKNQTSYNSQDIARLMEEQK
ncbi:FMN-binding negative transcriptional regulator [Sutcliffiella deserti]|uniref:FMN-binding negative transcriptional regulator n=1 Tax=Sutcliffiella deserti TaxID=2875501 RepID=UPI001CBA9803|nr:FMN-binding negative transcriptional regulator [Sutcliffiella deserti]